MRRIKTALLALSLSLGLTACASDPVIQQETRVPYVDPNLFNCGERPRLAPGDASWIDLRILAERLKLWGEQCALQLREVQGVLREASGEAERERDAREK